MSAARTHPAPEQINCYAGTLLKVTANQNKGPPINAVRLKP